MSEHEPVVGKVELEAARRPLPIFPFALGIVWALFGIFLISVMATADRNARAKDAPRG